MSMRHNAQHENDPTPSEEIARAYREAFDDPENDASLVLIHYRGGENEFLLGKKYCASDDAKSRATGADILAQLGWGDQTFQNESVPILIAMLNDPDATVIYSAAVGLGHRTAAEAIPALVEKIEHPDAQARLGVVFGLLGHDDERAISSLIKLAGDDDTDVRNWAVFGLGTQIETDSPDIREALRRALTDKVREIRGEALVGLAKRGDTTVVSDLLKEWESDDISLLSIEAAGITGNHRLHDQLAGFADSMDLDDDPHFADKLAEAISACEGS